MCQTLPKCAPAFQNQADAHFVIGRYSNVSDTLLPAKPLPYTPGVVPHGRCSPSHPANPAGVLFSGSPCPVLSVRLESKQGVAGKAQCGIVEADRFKVLPCGAFFFRREELRKPRH